MSLWCGVLEAGECFLHGAAAGAGVRSCALPKGDQKQEKCASVLKVPCVGAASAQPGLLLDNEGNGNFSSHPPHMVWRHMVASSITSPARPPTWPRAR